MSPFVLFWLNLALKDLSVTLDPIDSNNHPHNSSDNAHGSNHHGSHLQKSLSTTTTTSGNIGSSATSLKKAKWHLAHVLQITKKLAINHDKSKR